MQTERTPRTPSRTIAAALLALVALSAIPASTASDPIARPYVKEVSAGCAVDAQACGVIAITPCTGQWKARGEATHVVAWRLDTPSGSSWGNGTAFSAAGVFALSYAPQKVTLYADGEFVAGAWTEGCL